MHVARHTLDTVLAIGTLCASQPASDDVEPLATGIHMLKRAQELHLL